MASQQYVSQPLQQISEHINEVTDVLKGTTGIQSIEEQKSSPPRLTGRALSGSAGKQ